jgi:hypothetical protein
LLDGDGDEPVVADDARTPAATGAMEASS